MKAASVPIASHCKVPNGFSITNKEIYRIVENRVSMHYELCPKDWKNNSRKMGICEARQVFQYLTRNNSSYSYAEIGVLAGGLDHADVVHNVKKIKNLCSVYKEFNSMVDSIQTEIKKDFEELIKLNLLQ